jgi:hypothetical protein
VLDDFLVARAGLVRKDLIAYDPVGPRYQVLSLLPRPVIAPTARASSPDTPRTERRVAVRDMIRDFLARMDQPTRR